MNSEYIECATCDAEIRPNEIIYRDDRGMPMCEGCDRLLNSIGDEDE